MPVELHGVIRYLNLDVTRVDLCLPLEGFLDQGDQSQAMVRLSQAYALYQQLGAAGGMTRVRSGLRAAGTRLRHWTHADRPAFGWDSLTDTERRVADLVTQGLSNRQVANRIFLSPHTVAFHLRHIFWKLGVTSRVQLARMAAEQGSLIGDANIPSLGSSRLIWLAGGIAVHESCGVPDDAVDWVTRAVGVQLHEHVT